LSVIGEIMLRMVAPAICCYVLEGRSRPLAPYRHASSERRNSRNIAATEQRRAVAGSTGSFEQIFVIMKRVKGLHDFAAVVESIGAAMIKFVFFLFQIHGLGKGLRASGLGSS